MSSSLPSPECQEILALLSERRNVLISGPPATGKSTLLAEVKAFFLAGVPPAKAPPVLDHDAVVPIPVVAAPTAAPGLIMPAAGRPQRGVFNSVLHQSSKHRDFMTGIAPDLRSGATSQFRITEGPLYRASEYAKQEDHAALLIIDEINRGPAVQVFGGAIVAMEGEKRLGEDGQPRAETQYFDLLDPKTGDLGSYAFPSHLYILAAMNQADVSVEPLDVAFLRRWATFPLEPSATVLRSHFGLGAGGGELPETATDVAHVYEAAIRAWEAVNNRIALGRGPEFRIGHGVLMATSPAAPKDLGSALAHLARAWQAIRAHIDEAFFGDARGAAVILNADSGIDGNPYRLEEKMFGEMPRHLLTGPTKVRSGEIYGLLRAVAAGA